MFLEQLLPPGIEEGGHAVKADILPGGGICGKVPGQVIDLLVHRRLLIHLGVVAVLLPLLQEVGHQGACHQQQQDGGVQQGDHRAEHQKAQHVHQSVDPVQQVMGGGAVRAVPQHVKGAPSAGEIFPVQVQIKIVGCPLFGDGVIEPHGTVVVGQPPQIVHHRFQQAEEKLGDQEGGHGECHRAESVCRFQYVQRGGGDVQSQPVQHQRQGHGGDTADGGGAVPFPQLGSKPFDTGPHPVFRYAAGFFLFLVFCHSDTSLSKWLQHSIVSPIAGRFGKKRRIFGTKIPRISVQRGKMTSVVYPPSSEARVT